MPSSDNILIDALYMNIPEHMSLDVRNVIHVYFVTRYDIYGKM